YRALGDRGAPAARAPGSRTSSRSRSGSRAPLAARRCREAPIAQRSRASRRGAAVGPRAPRRPRRVADEAVRPPSFTNPLPDPTAVFRASGGERTHPDLGVGVLLQKFNDGSGSTVPSVTSGAVSPSIGRTVPELAGLCVLWAGRKLNQGTPCPRPSR